MNLFDLPEYDYAKIFKDILVEYNDCFEIVEVEQRKLSTFDSIALSAPASLYRNAVDGIMVARLKNTGKKPYISFRTQYKMWFIKHNVPTYEVKSDTGFFRIEVADFNAIDFSSEDFHKLVVQMCLDTMNYPSFGCCAKYKECSNAGKCLHIDPLYSTACMYRKNLEVGKIFYGNNGKERLMINQKIAVIDIETPNKHNNSVCSIGIVLVDEDLNKTEIYHLINPEAPFDKRNIDIHGITELDVADSPTFPEVWNEIKDIFSSYLLVGHNIKNTDLNVIGKSLNRYGISADPVYFIDTYHLSKQFIKDADNYGLSTLCNYYNLDPFEHHHALDDSRAALNLLFELCSEFQIDLDKYVEKFDFSKITISKKETTSKYCDKTKSLQELQGILLGVTADDELNDKEIYLIKKWADLHKELKGNYPYDRIYHTIEKVLEDGIITESERNGLLQLFYSIIDPGKGDLNEESNISIEGKNVCLTGDFECMEQIEFGNSLKRYGAILCDRVTKKLDFVVIGSLGSKKWTQNNFGNKVKKAMEYNEKGAKIKIISEKDFLEHFE